MSPSQKIFAKGFMHIFKIQNMDIENILLIGSYAPILSLQACLLYRLLHGWTWRRRMVHSQFRRILQSQIKKSRSDVITSNDGSQYITSLESTSRFRNLNPNFHASFSPCLTTYSFAALVVVIPMWIENHVIHPQYALSKNNPRSRLLPPCKARIA